MSVVALLGPLRSHGAMDGIEAYVCVCDVQVQDNMSCLIICYLLSLVTFRRRDDDRPKGQTLPAIAVRLLRHSSHMICVSFRKSNANQPTNPNDSDPTINNILVQPYPNHSNCSLGQKLEKNPQPVLMRFKKDSQTPRFFCCRPTPYHETPLTSSAPLHLRSPNRSQDSSIGTRIALLVALPASFLLRGRGP